MIQHVNGDEPNKIVGTGENWYPKKKEVIPRVYHKYLNQRDKDNIYNHLGDHVDEKEDKESPDASAPDTNVDGETDENQNGHDKEEIPTESAKDTTE